MRFHLINVDMSTVMEQYRDVILGALTDVGARSGTEYEPQVIYDHLRDHWVGDRLFALWLVSDVAKLQAGDPPNETIAGVTTLNVLTDEIGMPIAYISRGWGRPGYNGEHFDWVLPYIENWARDRGCTRILSSTERSCAGSAKRRHLTRRYVADRLAGLAAYWKWIGQRGFGMRQTVFEKVLKR